MTSTEILGLAQSGSTLSEDKTASAIAAKQQKTDKAAYLARNKLQNTQNTYKVVDGDTIKTQGIYDEGFNSHRFAGGVDTAETDHGEYSNSVKEQARISKQKPRVAEALGKSVTQVTNEDVFAYGEMEKKKLEQELFDENSIANADGSRRVNDVDIISHGDGARGRLLSEFVKGDQNLNQNALDRGAVSDYAQDRGTVGLGLHGGANDKDIIARKMLLDQQRDDNINLNAAEQYRDNLAVESLKGGVTMFGGAVADIADVILDVGYKVGTWDVEKNNDWFENGRETLNELIGYDDRFVNADREEFASEIINLWEDKTLSKTEKAIAAGKLIGSNLDLIPGLTADSIGYLAALGIGGSVKVGATLAKGGIAAKTVGAFGNTASLAGTKLGTKLGTKQGLEAGKTHVGNLMKTKAGKNLAPSKQAQYIEREIGRVAKDRVAVTAAGIPLAAAETNKNLQTRRDELGRPATMAEVAGVALLSTVSVKLDHLIDKGLLASGKKIAGTIKESLTTATEVEAKALISKIGKSLGKAGATVGGSAATEAATETLQESLNIYAERFGIEKWEQKDLLGMFDEETSHRLATSGILGAMGGVGMASAGATSQLVDDAAKGIGVKEDGILGNTLGIIKAGVQHRNTQAMMDKVRTVEQKRQNDANMGAGRLINGDTTAVAEGRTPRTNAENVKYELDELAKDSKLNNTDSMTKRNMTALLTNYMVGLEKDPKGADKMQQMFKDIQADPELAKNLDPVRFTANAINQQLTAIENNVGKNPTKAEKYDYSEVFDTIEKMMGSVDLDVDQQKQIAGYIQEAKNLMQDYISAGGVKNMKGVNKEVFDIGFLNMGTGKSIRKSVLNHENEIVDDILNGKDPSTNLGQLTTFAKSRVDKLFNENYLNGQTHTEEFLTELQGENQRISDAITTIKETVGSIKDETERLTVEGKLAKAEAHMNMANDYVARMKLGERIEPSKGPRGTQTSQSNQTAPKQPKTGGTQGVGTGPTSTGGKKGKPFAEMDMGELSKHKSMGQFPKIIKDKITGIFKANKERLRFHRKAGTIYTTVFSEAKKLPLISSILTQGNKDGGFAVRYDANIDTNGKYSEEQPKGFINALIQAATKQGKNAEDFKIKVYKDKKNYPNTYTNHILLDGGLYSYGENKKGQKVYNRVGYIQKIFGDQKEKEFKLDLRENKELRAFATSDKSTPKNPKTNPDNDLQVIIRKMPIVTDNVKESTNSGPQGPEFTPEQTGSGLTVPDFSKMSDIELDAYIDVMAKKYRAEQDEAIKKDYRNLVGAAIQYKKTKPVDDDIDLDLDVDETNIDLDEDPIVEETIEEEVAEPVVEPESKDIEFNVPNTEFTYIIRPDGNKYILLDPNGDPVYTYASISNAQKGAKTNAKKFILDEVVVTEPEVIPETDVVEEAVFEPRKDNAETYRDSVDFYQAEMEIVKIKYLSDNLSKEYKNLVKGLKVTSRRIYKEINAETTYNRILQITKEIISDADNDAIDYDTVLLANELEYLSFLLPDATASEISKGIKGVQNALTAGDASKVSDVASKHVYTKTELALNNGVGVRAKESVANYQGLEEGYNRLDELRKERDEKRAELRTALIIENNEKLGGSQGNNLVAQMTKEQKKVFTPKKTTSQTRTIYDEFVQPIFNGTAASTLLNFLPKSKQDVFANDKEQMNKSIKLLKWFAIKSTGAKGATYGLGLDEMINLSQRASFHVNATFDVDEDGYITHDRTGNFNPLAFIGKKTTAKVNGKDKQVLEFDPNTTEIIAMHTLSAYADIAHALETRDLDTLIEMYGYNPSTIDPDGAMTIINKAKEGYIPRSAIIQNVGKDIYSALGIKANANVDSTVEQQLITALGTFAISNLEDSGMLVNTGSDATFTVYDGVDNRPHSAVKMNPFAFNDETNKAMNKSLRDAITDLSYLVPSETAKEIEMEPIEQISANIKNSQYIKSESQIEAQKERQTVEWKMSPLVAKMQILGKNAFKKMAGWKDINDVNINEAEAQVSINEQHERNIDDMFKRYDGIGTKGFYIPWDVTKSDREMMEGAINPQASKIHRFMMQAKDMVSTISAKDLNKDNEDVRIFELSLTQALDLNTDKQSDKKSLSELEEKYMTIDYENKTITYKKTPEGIALENSVEFMRNPSDANAKLYEKDLIALGKAGEHIHAIQAADAIASLEDVFESGGDFTHELMLEADAVTSGMALTLFQIGSKKSLELLSKTGIYTPQIKKVFQNMLLLEPARAEALWDQHINEGDGHFNPDALEKLLKKEPGYQEKPTNEVTHGILNETNWFFDFYTMIGVEAVRTSNDIAAGIVQESKNANNGGIGIKNAQKAGVILHGILSGTFLDKDGNIKNNVVRKIAKSPVMVYIYGSSINSIKKKLAYTIGKDKMVELLNTEGMKDTDYNQFNGVMTGLFLGTDVRTQRPFMSVKNSGKNFNSYADLAGYVAANMARAFPSETPEMSLKRAELGLLLMFSTNKYILDPATGESNLTKIYPKFEKIDGNEIVSMDKKEKKTLGNMMVTDEMVGYLKGAVDVVYGSAFEKAFNSNFDEVNEYRDSVKTLEILNFNMFNYNFKKNLKAVANKDGQVTKQQMYDIVTNLIETGLGHNLPSIHGGKQGLDKQDETGSGHNIQVDKSNYSRSNPEITAFVDTFFKEKNEQSLKENSKLTAGINDKKYVSNLRAAPTISIHSIDSMLLRSPTIKKQILHIYDAVGVGSSAETYMDTNKDYNEGTVQHSREWSVLSNYMAKINGMLTTMGAKEITQMFKELKNPKELDELREMLGGFKSFTNIPFKSAHKNKYITEELANEWEPYMKSIGLSPAYTTFDLYDNNYINTMNTVQKDRKNNLAKPVTANHMYVIDGYTHEIPGQDLVQKAVASGQIKKVTDRLIDAMDWLIAEELKIVVQDRKDGKRAEIKKEIYGEEEVITEPEVKSEPVVTEGKSQYYEADKNVIQSGGALGADSYWAAAAQKFKIKANAFYSRIKTPTGNTNITEEERAEGIVKAKEAATALNRNWSNKEFVQNLLARNWMQVKSSDQVIAISTIASNGTQVAGGTGYAVEMAKTINLPIFVFDQNRNKWYKYSYTSNRFVQSHVPSAAGNTAGIGSRKLTPAGQNAIVDTFRTKAGDTIEQSTPKPVVKDDGVKHNTSEAADVAAILRRLGIKPTKKDGKATISKVVKSQSDLIKAITNNKISNADIAKIFDYVDIDAHKDEADRGLRAYESAAKYGSGTKGGNATNEQVRKHMLMQLVEELGEVLDENIKDPKKKALIELQKRILKVERFLPQTVNKSTGISNSQQMVNEIANNSDFNKYLDLNKYVKADDKTAYRMRMFAINAINKDLTEVPVKQTQQSAPKPTPKRVSKEKTAAQKRQSLEKTIIPTLYRLGKDIKDIREKLKTATKTGAESLKEKYGKIKKQYDAANNAAKALGYTQETINKWLKAYADSMTDKPDPDDTPPRGTKKKDDKKGSLDTKRNSKDVFAYDEQIDIHENFDIYLTDALKQDGLLDEEGNNNPSNTDADNQYIENIDNVVNMIKDTIAKYDANPNFKLEVYGTDGSTYGTADVSGRVMAIMYGDSSLYDSAGVMTHELLHIFTEHAMNINPAFRAEIREIQEQVAKNIHGYSFFLGGEVNPTSEQVQTAKDMYNYVVTGDESEFMAYGMTNRNMMEQIEKIDIKHKIMDEMDGTSNFHKMMNRFIQVFNTVAHSISAALGGKNPRVKEKANKALSNVVDRMVEFQAKQENKLREAGLNDDGELDSKWEERYRKMDDKFIKANKKLEEKSEKIFKTLSDKLEHNKFFDRMTEINGLKQIKQTRLFQDVFFEITKSTATPDVANFYKLFRVAKKEQEKDKEDFRTNLGKVMKEDFLKGLDDNTLKSLKTTLINSDAMALLDNGFTMEDIQAMLEDEKVLNKNIQEARDALGTGRTADEYKEQAQGLGHYIMTSEAKIDNQMKNSHNIYHGFFQKEGVIKKHQDAAGTIKRIDTLASLYALKYAGKEDKANAVKAIDTNAEGIQNTLQVKDRHMKEYNKTLFDKYAGQSKISVEIKGYSVPLNDENKDYEIVGEEDAPMFKRMGYVIVKEDHEGITGGEKRYLMVGTDYSPTYHKGVLDIIGFKRKGRTFRDILSSHGATKSEEDTEAIVEAQVNKNYGHRASGKELNFENADSKFMPSLAMDGKITDFSTELSQNDRIKYLTQNENIIDTVANTLTYTSAKESAVESNNRAIDAIQEDARKNYAKNPDKFVILEPMKRGAKSTDHNEMWAMIPEYTREYIVYGNRSPEELANPQERQLIVRKALLNDVIGYRAFSISNIGNMKKKFPKISSALNIIEAFWISIVSKFKGIIVTMTGEVIVSNMLSNMFVAWQHGVNPVEYARKVVESWKLINQYEADSTAYNSMKIKAASGIPVNSKAMENMKQKMEKNKMHTLIQGGLFTPIVEDVNISITRERSPIDRVIDRGLKKLPEGFKKTLDVAYLSENTNLYKMMLKLTQYGDITARYAILESKAIKKSDMTMDQKIAYLDEMLVNYSYNENKYLRYMNDIGLFMFSKYFLRTPKAIIRMMKRNPTASSLFQGAQYVTGVDIIDPVDTFYNPFDAIVARMGNPGDIIVQILDPNIFEVPANPLSVVYST